MTISIFIIQVHTEAALTQPWWKSDILINPAPPVGCQVFYARGLAGSKLIR